MKVLSWFRWIVGFAILGSLSVVPDAPATQAYRVFVARTNAVASSSFGGPTRHEYVTNFRERRECNGIFPTSREDLSDFTVWFEYDGDHSALLWDWQGNLVYSNGGVNRSTNIVKDVCNAIRSRPPLPRQYNNPG